MDNRRGEYVRRVNRVMDYIETHLDEPLPLEALAGIACFSHYHFHRIFFGHTGETPGQFIQRLRIGKAARLLMAHHSRAVTDIGLECGFSDSAAFSRAFRVAFGRSPTAFRNLCTTDRNRSTAGDGGKPPGDDPGLRAPHRTVLSGINCFSSVCLPRCIRGQDRGIWCSGVPRGTPSR